MSELIDYFEMAKSNHSIKPKFSVVFEFPFNNDYIEWIYHKSQGFPSGRKHWKSWNDFYGHVIEHQIEPAGVEIPDEWYKRLISYPTKSVYLIGDYKEELLYIGKCEFPPIISLLSKMIPKKLEPLNNVPEIWDEIISKGNKVKCAYVFDLGDDPNTLKSSLLINYKEQHGTLPRCNKRGPTI